MGHDSIEYPKVQKDDQSYSFSQEELNEINYHISKYPEKRSAVMPALWIAQRKYGWLPQGAIKLVAETLDLSFAHVYGVATFYTMYLKEKRGKHLVEICTCFTCGVCNGDQLFKYALKSNKCNEEGISSDQEFWFREAECLGACDSAPVVQVDNEVICFDVDESKLDQILDKLKRSEEIEYVPVPLKDQTNI